MIWSIIAFIAVWAAFYYWATHTKKLSKIVGHGGGFLAALLAFAVTVPPAPGSPETKPMPPASAEEVRKEAMKKLFSQWDGSLPALVAVVERSMHNPKSFEHVETAFWDMGEHLVVRMTYRGTNTFGGVVTNWVKAKVTLQGEVIDIMEQGS